MAEKSKGVDISIGVEKKVNSSAVVRERTVYHNTEKKKKGI
jgi:hypothetical protein